MEKIISPSARKHLEKKHLHKYLLPPLFAVMLLLALQPDTASASSLQVPSLGPDLQQNQPRPNPNPPGTNRGTPRPPSNQRPSPTNTPEPRSAPRPPVNSTPNPNQNPPRRSINPDWDSSRIANVGCGAGESTAVCVGVNPGGIPEVMIVDDLRPGWNTADSAYGLTSETKRQRDEGWAPGVYVEVEP